MIMRERHRVEISGVVQGVGFRPFVHRLACELKLSGWTGNSLSGVVVEFEGPADACAAFLHRVRSDAPPRAGIRGITASRLPVDGGSDFVIRHSSAGGAAATTEIMPDLAPCADCVSEILDPGDHRYGHPFTNCTQCGPRFSIVLSLPFDRERTTMRAFSMCPQCREEYESPGNRRFHAQANACTDCGPQLAFADSSGRTLGMRADALDLPVVIEIEHGRAKRQVWSRHEFPWASL